VSTIRNLELYIPDVRARNVLVLHQDGILSDSASKSLGDVPDYWAQSIWSFSSSQIGAIGEGMDKRSI